MEDLPAKITVRDIQQSKGKRRLVCLTAYDAAMAPLVDAAGVDLILVGDSVGNTQLGFSSTVPVTLDMMIHHTAAVARTRPRALLVADVPFTHAHYDFDRVLESCARLVQEGGADAVKIEGGANLAARILRLVEAGIPVLGHIGLQPQRVQALGGFRKFGRTQSGRQALREDAQALTDAGCFAVLGEMIEAEAAEALTNDIDVPFIGIGCGPHTDGQILVLNDVLGLSQGFYPSFAKQYVDLGSQVRDAVEHYADEVRGGAFPS